MAFLPPKIITDKILNYHTLSDSEKRNLDRMCDNFLTPRSTDNENEYLGFLLSLGFGLFF
jgi:hypothetical protein